MPTVLLNAFGGMFPRTGRRLLPNGAAIRVENCKLQSGELRPIRQPYRYATPSKPMPPVTIFRGRNPASNSTIWMTWPQDVDVVKVPFSAESESRYCWTGDGEPRMAKHADAAAGGLNDYPHTSFALGIPTPQEKPAVTASGGVSSTSVTRFYCCTFYSQYAEESAPSPISASISGKVDGTFAVTNLPDLPVNNGTMTGLYAAGETTFACATKHWLRPYDPVIVGQAQLTVKTVVSPTSFVVEGDYSVETAWARLAPWNVTGMKRRLYRTTGSSGSWQLVADDVTGATYNDTLTDSQILGDELISEGWEPPDPRMTCLGVHASGALYGVFDKVLCLSEPLQPHAWPKKYRQTTDSIIVGAAAFSSSIVLATQGSPHVATGVEPVSMGCEPIRSLYPCLSKRSVISVGDAVVYASAHGLVAIGASGLSLFSEPFFTRDEWLPLNPASMFCAFSNGRVLCAFKSNEGNNGILVFDNGQLTQASLDVSEIYADEETGDVFLGMADGIYLYDSATQSYPMRSAYRSRELVFAKPCDLGVGKIDFQVAIPEDVLQGLIAQREAAFAANQEILARGRAFGAINDSAYNAKGVGSTIFVDTPDLPPSNEVQFVLRKDEEILFQKVVRNNKAFRIKPAKVKYDHCSVEVSSQGIIYEVRVAETMEALAQT